MYIVIVIVLQMSWRLVKATGNLRKHVATSKSEQRLDAEKREQRYSSREKKAPWQKMRK